MQDQRLVNRLQNYWDLIRRGKSMPNFSQFNPSTIDDLWAHCMVLSVAPTQNGRRYMYSYVGDALVQMFGSNLLGSAVDSKAVNYPFSVIIKMLDATYEQGKVATDQNQIINDKGKIIKYRACFLPFGTEGRGITHFVVGISDKQF